jgi:hypothetical protein
MFLTMVLYYYFLPPIEASSIDRTHQSRAPEDEGRAIPRNVVVYKQGDDGESPKLKKNSNFHRETMEKVQNLKNSNVLVFRDNNFPTVFSDIYRMMMFMISFRARKIDKEYKHLSDFPALHCGHSASVQIFS